MSSLIKAHGGTLVERILSPTEALALQERASQLETVTLDEDELLDLELLASGGASPLSGFMGQRDHRSVLDQQRLAGGALFPVPIVLSVSVGRLGALAPGTLVALRDTDGALRGAMTVRDTFVRDVREEARLVHGTDDPAHPGAARLLARPAGALGGEVALIRPRDLRFETAREVRLRLAQHGFFRVAAGLGTKLPQAANAARDHADALLVQSLSGPVALDPRFPVVVACLPIRDRAAGARRVLLQALTLRNFGVSHLVLGDAGVDLDTADALVRYHSEVGLELVTAPVGGAPRYRSTVSSGGGGRSTG